MKQIDKSPKIQAMLQRAAGDGVSTDDLVVYEAIALNTLPLRKRSVLYDGAVAERGLLVEMADRLNAESLPLYVNHDKEPLPIGRVFFGEVHNTGTGSELRVLFSVSKTETDVIQKIDNGVVDQVSVSILPKHILCSNCGFDYLGATATFDNIYNGVCDKGHKLGQGGVHTNLVGLDQYFETSLVGRGGAQGARIVSRDKSKFGSSLNHLAASGMDPNALVLVATSGMKLMDLETLITQLTDTKATLSNTTGELASVKAALTQKDAKIADLTAQLAATGDSAKSIADKDAEIVRLKEDGTAALTQLKEIAKNVLVASGDVNPTVPETVVELIQVIKTKGEAMAAALKAGGSKGATGDETKSEVKPVSLNSFRAPR